MERWVCAPQSLPAEISRDPKESDSDLGGRFAAGSSVDIFRMVTVRMVLGGKFIVDGLFAEVFSIRQVSLPER